MSDSAADLTDSQSQQLYECVEHARTGNSIAFACTALFLFDYALTVSDEARYVWWPRRVSISSVSFMLARYLGMASTILTALLATPNADSSMDSTTTVLRLAAIVLSEFIVAVRTWAIWGKSRNILITLVVFSLAAVIPASIIVAQSVKTSHVKPLVSEDTIGICSIITSNITQGFIVPYILTIIYEAVTLTLSLVRIVKWRKTIPKNIRAPLIDSLWRDGVLYFSWMLSLGFVNIGIVLQSEAPQLRAACAQLQAVFHSILSTRIVLHLASSNNPRDITTAGCSVYNTDTDIQFTTQFETTTERYPVSHHPEEE